MPCLKWESTHPIVKKYSDTNFFEKINIKLHGHQITKDAMLSGEKLN